MFCNTRLLLSSWTPAIRLLTSYTPAIRDRRLDLGSPGPVEDLGQARRQDVHVRRAEQVEVAAGDGADLESAARER